MKYLAKIDIKQKNNSHTQVFDLINSHSRGRVLKVLEVGCSSGYFGAALMDFGHKVWGIEPYDIAATEAKKVLVDVYVGFIENYFNENPDSMFDVIVFGDVLEHLLDPVEVLKLCKNHLYPSGIIVSSMPNVAHFAIRALLLEGRWEYADLGILDRTHLAFYTKASIIEMYSKAGFLINHVSSVKLGISQVDEICKLELSKKYIDLVERHCDDPLGFDFQYIVSASPTSDPMCTQKNTRFIDEDGIRVLVVCADPTSSIVDIRLRTPLTKWADDFGGFLKVVSIYDDNSRDFAWADVIIFQREVGEYIDHLVDFFKKNNKKIVYELDDLLFNLPDFLSHHREVIDRSVPYMRSVLNKADAVSVSTIPLKEKIPLFNDNIYVTPNYAEPVNVPAQHSDVAADQITLIVASSDSVWVDCLVEPLKFLIEKFNLKVLVIGPPYNALKHLGSNVIFNKNLSHEEFKKLISKIDNGIGIIPLDNSEFSNCKSAVKYFDYSVCGIPSVCSDVLPYKEVVNHGSTGFLVGENCNDWVEGIESLILSASLRRNISEAARQNVVANYSLDVSANVWHILLSNLISTPVVRSLEPVALLAPNRKLKQLLKLFFRHSIKPSSYRKAFSVVKNYGLRDLLRRFRNG